MDTGTVRPGLEKSTYKVRRAECDELVDKAKKAGFAITCLADIRDKALFDKIKAHFDKSAPHLVARMDYIYNAQKRFYQMMDAWKAGDIETVGRIFRQDGVGLRDDYAISGPELETMCDIVRTIPGVLGERMLGGGDKGAAGALVLADSADAVNSRETATTRSRRPLPTNTRHTAQVVDHQVSIRTLSEEALPLPQCPTRTAGDFLSQAVSLGLWYFFYLLAVIRR
jgi:galactokinase